MDGQAVFRGRGTAGSCDTQGFAESSPATEGHRLARENYKFAQRKRELDKKRKKEEKAQRKAAERAARPAEGQEATEAELVTGPPAAPDPEA
jgi:hypothetical protein